MSIRDKFRKFKSETKSRIFQTNDTSNGGLSQPSPTSPSGTSQRWNHLGTFLGALEHATKPLSPLKIALTELTEFIDCYDSVLHERKEYEVLHHELEALFQALQHQFTQNTPPAVTGIMEALCRSIQDEVTIIRQIQGKGKLRGYFNAEENIGTLLACCRRIQGHLGRISLNADISIWRIADEIATDNRLKSLSPSLSASYNSAQAIELKRGPCTKSTRVDLLSQMLDWVNNSSPGSVYWMSGMAGTGKTTIAYSLCEELDASYKLAASFFCSRLLPECRDANMIIPSIAYQLARFSHPFRFVLSRILEKDPDVHTRLPHIQFGALISKPLLEVKDTLPANLIVIIDALDECGNKQSTGRVLDVLLAKSSGLPIKFMVSSRPEPEVRDEMTKQADKAECRVVLHELDKRVVQTDIETYLRSMLSQMDPTEEQISTLVQRAGILFIYAATAVRYISYDKFQRNPHARLANVIESRGASENKYKEIDELYTIILQAALDDPTLDKNEAEDMRRVLHLAICAQEPLTTDAISKLLSMNSAGQVRNALRPLWSVLHISGINELVTTLHASFPDYIFDPSRSKKYHCDPRVYDQTIAWRCFDLFRKLHPQFNICSLDSSYKSDDEVEGLEERVKSVVSIELFYASRYWGVHLHGSAGSPGLLSELEEFLSVRLLLWMEVMNLKKYTGMMPQIIRLVETWKVERSVELNALIHDAWRFTSTFALGEVSDSTPHIYISLLPLWPNYSPIFKCYSTRVQRVIQAKGTAIGKRQDALLATWTLDDRVSSSAFSPDGTLIAVGLTGLSSELLMLSATTGCLMLPPFEGHHGSVASVQFSPDGSRVVSGSGGGTICIWDTRNGELNLGPLPGHNSWIPCVAFSPDGDRIVSGAGDGGVHVWDSRSGERLLGLSTGYRQGVRSVEYSPGGCSILSCGLHENILIWNSRDGQLLMALSSRSDPNSFVYADISPDGTHIVSGSDDGSIHIWDYKTGRLTLGPLIAPGTDSPLQLVRYSHDGSHLISGSTYGTVCIWDTHSGEISLGPLTGHTGRVTSASFSPDGAYFISGSTDRTLRLWDIQALKPAVGPLGAHPDPITSIIFSPDGTRIISSTDYQTICVWDAESGVLVRGPLENDNGVNYWVQPLFSSNGIHDVSVTNRGIVLQDAQLGDVALGPIHPQSVRSIAFSPDGTCIISGSSNNIVHIFAIDTGQTLMVVHIPLTDADNMPNWIHSVTISPDGTRIVVDSWIGLSVYDTHTGRLLCEPFSVLGHHPYSVGFSPDSTHIVYSTGLSLVVRDLRGGEGSLTQLEAPPDLINQVDFSPDGVRVASGSADGSICIWDARTGQLLLGPVRWHSNSVTSLKFSPDGTRVASGSKDKTLRITNIGSTPMTQNFEDWEMLEDGWVVDRQSRLLVWIPADLRTTLMWPRTKLLISKKGSFRLDFEGACLGEAWTECYRPTAAQ